MPLARREPYCPRCLEPNPGLDELEFVDLMAVSSERPSTALAPLR